MKKLTILLVIVMFILYGVRYYEDANTPSGGMMNVKAAENMNKQLSDYAGDKVRGSSVNALMDLVRTLNIQEVFPVDIELVDGDDDIFSASPATGIEYTNSGDRVRDSAWFEVVIRDDQANDGFLDSIYIRSYSIDSVTGAIVSKEP